MASTIFVSDEYGWTASWGLFEWVIEFLLGTVGDEPTRQELRQVMEHNLGAVMVSELSAPGRREVLDALRTGLVPAATASLAVHQEPAHRKLTIGHVKVLKLMADDVLRQ
ncbi:hypothetical protein ACFFWC_23565 [Plantactinospora siamensis]|uniref:Uncharacterized protein n=1 Tax=Plantactinospora siamensis TaxID=555372 RepID=A0ABV6NUH3_9ACTN